jgi:RHS repeat-associated protein
LAFSYTDGDLTAVTDPMGRTSTDFTDAAGRLSEVTDPAGDTTTMQYNALNELTAVSDPLGETSSATYDPDGDVLSVTDPDTHSTLFTYDSMNRLTKVTDPLGHSQTYAYDPAGDVVGYTDANGTVDSFDYDLLGRLIEADIGSSPAGPASHTSYAYDQGNRLVKVVSSSSGTLSDTWDRFDRLVSQSTPQGRVTYRYDPDGRRTSMTLMGHVPVRYTYDAAGDLTGESQGPVRVGITYDGDGLPTALSLPGQADDYAYDGAGELTGIDVLAGSATEGTLQYSYDADGQETTLTGSLARMLLPAPAASVTYNADSELTGWDGSTITYDAQGQMTADGDKHYTWGPGHQLVAVNEPGQQASFAYDAFGRRTSQTVNGTTTSYIYDGTSELEDLMGGKPTEELLTTPGGQTLLSTNASGTDSLISDRLGSTVALANAKGELGTVYAYGPFGMTSTMGAATANVAGYAGEHEDASGLYYDNARYYSPTLGRFISTDPLGIDGGSANPYEYADDDPIDWGDPTGLFLPILIPILGGAIIGGIEGALFNVANNALENVLSGRKYSGGQAAQDALSGAATGALLGALGGFVGGALGGAGGGGEGGWGGGGSPLAPGGSLGGEAGSGPLGNLGGDGPVFSGHGQFGPENGTITVPEGTSLGMYTEHGTPLGNDVGNQIELGNPPPPVQVYLPGDQVPNYTLYPPGDLALAGSPVTVNAPTLLGDLLQPGMGFCKWAACR